MAGDWIPAESSLPRKPKVLILASTIGINRREVVGILVEFWLWASEQTEDGFVPGLAIEQLPHIFEGVKPAFWRAMLSPQVNWIEQRDGGLYIPRADRWITKGAKARLLKSRRQAEWRSGEDDEASTPVDTHVDTHVDTLLSTRPSTEASTTEEKSKEEKRIKKEKKEKRIALPADFALDGSRLAYAEGKGIQRNSIATVFEAFRANHSARGSVFVSWDAAWRTWVLNEINWPRGRRAAACRRWALR